jgi:hypothetical protein
VGASVSTVILEGLTDSNVWEGGLAWSKVYVDGRPIDAYKTDAALASWVPGQKARGPD